MSTASSSTEDDADAQYLHLGEQAEWGIGIPKVFRALAAPRNHGSILAAPEPGDDISVACAYWTPLLHLLRYSFGWARPDLGLKWWYEASKPIDDPRLALIAEIWGADGRLDWFAAWLWSDNWFGNDSLLNVHSHAGQAEPVARDRNWIEEQRRAADASGIHAPISAGGGNPLHLSSHCNGPLDGQSGNALLVRTRRAERRAVLLLDSMRGWYRALRQQGTTLPALGDRSWRVEVVVKPVGFLGTYRRSSETGLWFAGRHRYHRHGNP